MPSLLDYFVSVKTTGVGTVKAELASIATSASTTDKKVGSSMKRIGSSMRSVGSGMSKFVTLPIVAVGAASIKMATDYEASMNKIQGLVGVSQKQVAQWSDQILALAQKLPQSPKELADAMFFVTSAGLKGKDAMDALTASARASAAGLGETKVVADAVTSAMNAYSKSGLSASQATDILTTAVRDGKMEASDLAPVLGNILPLASEMGVGFDDVAAAIASMTRTGTNAATAGTNIQGMLSGLIKPSDDGKEALAGVGMSFGDIREEIEDKGLFPALMDVRDAFGSNTTALAKVIPNVRALRGFLSLTGDQAEANAKIFKDMANSTGVADKAFQSASQTASFKFQAALSSLQVAAIKVGTAMLPMATRLVGAIASLADKFSGLSPSVLAAVAAFAGVAAAIGPLLVVTGLLVSSLGALAPLIAVSGPIALGLAGLAAVGLALYKNWDKVGPAVQKVWGHFEDLVGVFKAGFTGDFSKVQDIIQKMPEEWQEGAAKVALFAEKVGKAATKLKDFIDRVETGVGDAFREAFGDLSDSDLKVIKNAGTKAGDATVSAYAQEVDDRGKDQKKQGSAGWKFGFAVGAAIGKGLTYWAKHPGGGGEGRDGALSEFLTSLLDPHALQREIQRLLGPVFRGIWQGLVGDTNWQAVHKRLGDILIHIFTFDNLGGKIMKDLGIDKLVDNIVGVWKSLPKRLRQSMPGIQQALTHPFQFAFNLLVGHSIVPEMVDGIVRIITTLPGRIMGSLKSLPSTLVNFWKNKIWQPMANFVTEKANGIMQTLSNWKAKAVAWVKSLVGSLLNFWKNQIWQPIANFVVQKSEGIQATVSNLKQKMLDVFHSLPSPVQSAFEAIGKAMSSPIETAYNRIVDFVNDIITVVNTVLKAFGQDPITLVSHAGGPSTPNSGQGRNDLQLGRHGNARIRAYARGGVVDGEDTYLVGDKRQREYVINPSRPDNERYLRSAAREMGYGVTRRGRPVEASGSASGSWPPKAPQYRNVKSDGNVWFKAARDAIEVARQGASMWRGLVKEATNTTNSVYVRRADIGAHGLTYPGGVVEINDAADRFVMGHEFGHTLGLGHGGVGIMGGRGRAIGGPSQGDFDAIAAYYGGGGGAGPGGVGGAPAGYKLPPLRGPGATRNWNSTVYEIVRAITHAVPGTNPNTYAGHAGGEEWSSDWWNMGGRGDPVPKNLGDAVASQITKTDGWRWYIWQGLLHNAGGSTQPYNGTFAGHPDKHFNHIHGTWGAGAGTGGAGISLGELIWNRLSSLLPNVPSMGPGVLGSGARAYLGGYKEWIHSWLLSAFGGGGGPTGNTSLGGDPAKNQALGKKMLAQSGVAGSWSALDQLWTRESGWDRFAENPFSGAYGIPQALPPTKLPAAGQKSGGSHAGPQVDWGLGYIDERYGSTDAAWKHSQSTGWYDTGGLIRSDHLAKLHANEIVLPLDNPKTVSLVHTMAGTDAIEHRLERLENAIVGKLDDVNLSDRTVEKQVIVAREGQRSYMRSTEGKGAVITAVKGKTRGRVLSGVKDGGW